MEPNIIQNFPPPNIPFTLCSTPLSSFSLCHAYRGRHLGMAIFNHILSRTSNLNSGEAMALATDATSKCRDRLKSSKPNRAKERKKEKGVKVRWTVHDSSAMRRYLVTSSGWMILGERKRAYIQLQRRREGGRKGIHPLQGSWVSNPYRWVYGPDRLIWANTMTWKESTLKNKNLSVIINKYMSNITTRATFLQYKLMFVSPWLTVR